MGMKQFENIFSPETLEQIKLAITAYGLKILGALAVFFVGKWIARVLSNLAATILEKSHVDETFSQFMANLIYYALLIVVILTTLAQLGVQTTSFLAILGSAGLAIGLALQGSLGNFAAGVLLIIFRPFQVGEYIEGAGVGGTVHEIKLLVTQLNTPDNKVLFVPNGKLMGDNITNYSRNPTRRCDMILGVSYDDDIDKVRAIIEDVLGKEERILEEPEPVVGLIEFGESSVNFTVRPWVNTSDYLTTKMDLLAEFKRRFDTEGISIPYPQQDIHLHQVKAGS
jgi:small conductance mechanosensitive channel